MLTEPNETRNRTMNMNLMKTLRAMMIQYGWLEFKI